MKRLPVFLALIAFALPLSAQDLQRPADWKVRFDRAGSTEADLEMFVEMPPGWHITTGPAAIFWHPDVTAEGDFKVETEIFLFDPGRRREAFGLFFGGRDLEGEGQRYSYFLIRNGGEYIIKRREGTEAPTVRPWTAHPSILSFADRGEDVSVRNVLTVACEGATCAFSVNGDEVTTVPRAELFTDGVVGLRVNHALNVHVSRLDVTPLG